MPRHRVVSSFLCAVTATAFLSAACKRGESPVPPAEVRSQATQAVNQPTTISGCLKAGEASDTFVLTAAQTQGSGETATYQLVPPAGMDLRDHVGRQVEVSGTVNAKQELTSRSSAQPADRATGTSGTPKVETRTEVEIKRLEVSAVKPLGTRCDM
jgi:hypothetical protein